MEPQYFFPLLGMVFALGWGVLGTVRWYLGQKLRADRADGALPEGSRVAALETRVGELEERLDFAERLLARGGGEMQER